MLKNGKLTYRLELTFSLSCFLLSALLLWMKGSFSILSIIFHYRSSWIYNMAYWHKGWFFPRSSNCYCSWPLVVCTLSSAGLSCHKCFHCQGGADGYHLMWSEWEYLQSQSDKVSIHISYINIWVLKASPLPCCQSQMKLGMKLEDATKGWRTRKTLRFRSDKAGWPAVVFELCSLLSLHYFRLLQVFMSLLPTF